MFTSIYALDRRRVVQHPISGAEVSTPRQASLIRDLDVSSTTSMVFSILPAKHSACKQDIANAWTLRRMNASRGLMQSPIATIATITSESRVSYHSYYFCMRLEPRLSA